MAKSSKFQFSPEEIEQIESTFCNATVSHYVRRGMFSIEKTGEMAHDHFHGHSYSYGLFL